MTDALKAVEKYLKEYEELYLVTCYIENDVAGTNLWELYADVKDATRWIDLCLEYYRGHSRYFEENYRIQIGDLISEIEFMHSDGENLDSIITERFVTEVFKA